MSVNYDFLVERMRRGLSDEIAIFKETLREIERAWETKPEKYVYVPKKVKVVVQTAEDICAPGAWGSVDSIAYREEEREIYEEVERPEYKEEIRKWRESMRPLAERAATLLRLFPVKWKGAGYMRWVCTDGTIEDYDWFEFRKGFVLGALGITISEYEKMVNFVKFVLAPEEG